VLLSLVKLTLFANYRYAAEHWIHSHPSVRPCDLHTDPKYVWLYEPLPDGDYVKEFQLAPRYPLKTYVKKEYCAKDGQSLQQRLDEYKVLYDVSPSKSWWGWKLYVGERAVRTKTRSEATSIIATLRSSSFFSFFLQSYRSHRT